MKIVEVASCCEKCGCASSYGGGSGNGAFCEAFGTEEATDDEDATLVDEEATLVDDEATTDDEAATLVDKELSAVD